MVETLLPFGIFISVSAFLLALIMLVVDLKRARARARQTEESLLRDIEDDAFRQIIANQSKSNDNSDWFSRLADESDTGVTGPLILLFMLGGAIVGTAIPVTLLDSLVGGMVGCVVGLLVPLLIFVVIRERRVLRLQKELPGVLEILADSLHSGHSMEQAIDVTANEIDAPLKPEFQYCAHQLQLGQPLLAAVERLSKRIPVTEFRIFLTAVVVHRQTGGNLALLAERLARASRDRIEFHSYIRAVSSGSRFSIFGMMGGVLIGLALLSTMRPEYTEVFFTTSTGNFLIVVAVILQCIGCFWVWNILKVKF